MGLPFSRRPVIDPYRPFFISDHTLEGGGYFVRHVDQNRREDLPYYASSSKKKAEGVAEFLQTHRPDLHHGSIYVNPILDDQGVPMKEELHQFILHVLTGQGLKSSSWIADEFIEYLRSRRLDPELTKELEQMADDGIIMRHTVIGLPHTYGRLKPDKEPPGSVFCTDLEVEEEAAISISLEWDFKKEDLIVSFDIKEGKVNFDYEGLSIRKSQGESLARRKNIKPLVDLQSVLQEPSALFLDMAIAGLMREAVEKKKLSIFEIPIRFPEPARLSVKIEWDLKKKRLDIPIRIVSKNHSKVIFNENVEGRLEAHMNAGDTHISHVSVKNLANVQREISLFVKEYK